MSPGRTLDFIVIGATKSATTTLWKGLSTHPQLALPADKERGFFNSAERYAQGLDRYIQDAFPHAEPGQRVGTVTPMYMASDGLERVIARMHATVPGVRLIAMLRDPIDRAVSRFRQALRQGTARGATFDEHVAQAAALDEDMLADSEYGRILSAYTAAFPRTSLHVVFTEDFARWPATCYRGIFEHLGVAVDHVPPLDLYLNRGGTRLRIDDATLDQLLGRLDATVWPHVADRREPRRGVEWWLRHVWNIEPDDQAREMSAELRARLQARYLADAESRRAVIGVQPPWAGRYAGEAQSARSSDGQIAVNRSTSGA